MAPDWPLIPSGMFSVVENDTRSHCGVATRDFTNVPNPFAINRDVEKEMTSAHADSPLPITLAPKVSLTESKPKWFPPCLSSAPRHDSPIDAARESCIFMSHLSTDRVYRRLCYGGICLIAAMPNQLSRFVQVSKVKDSIF